MASLYQVKASAGSGKTYDLTRRFLCLLAACGAPGPAAASSCGLGSGPSGWDEILAITFTNAAAGEMRDRVIGRLKAIALGTPEQDIPLTPGMAARWLEVILRDLASLNIRTIDSLLHAIVRSASLQLDLPPDFQPAFVSMDAVTPYLETLLNQASQGDEAMEKLLRDLYWAIVHVQQSKGFNAGEKLGDIIRPLLDGILRGEFTDIAGPEELGERHRQHWHRTIGLVTDVLEAEEGAGTRLHATSRKALVRLQERDEGAFKLKSIAEPGVDRFLTAKTKRTEALMTALEALVAWLPEFRRRHALLRSARHFAPAVQLATLLVHAMRANQQQEGTLPAVLVPELAASVLGGSFGVSEALCRLGSRLQYFLLDEFQDTSREQWQALSPLVEEALSRGGSLTWVGDVKQAIYGWRGGDAALFDGIEGPLRRLAPDVRHETLTANWRSCRQIIAHNNALFSPLEDAAVARQALAALMPQDTPDDLLDGYAGRVAAGYAGTAQDFSPRSASGGLVRVEAIEGDNSEGLNAAVLVRLRRMILHELAPRRSWQDMLVLVRSNAQAALVAEDLAAASIPIVTENSLLLSTHPLVIQSVALLQFLCNAEDELALWTVVTGSLVQQGPLPVPGLQELHDTCVGRGRTSLLPHLQQQFPDFWASVLAPFHNQAGLMTPYDTIMEWYDRLQVFQRCPEADVFLRCFLEVLKNAEDQGLATLPDFLAHWQEKGGEEKVPMPEGIDAVRIMTVHKSKGLEAPVVLLPWTDASLKANDPVLMEEDGLRMVCKNGPHCGRVYYEALLRQATELLNQFYVAFTRAREELYVFRTSAATVRRGCGSHALDVLWQQAGLTVPYQLEGGDDVLRPVRPPAAEDGEEETDTAPDAATADADPGQLPRGQAAAPSVPEEGWRPMQWLPRLKIYRNPLERMHFSARDRGTLLHACLEQLPLGGLSEDNIRVAVREVLATIPLADGQDGPDRENVAADMESCLLWLLRLPQFGLWQRRGVPEQSMLEADGPRRELLRADLIVPLSWGTLVVDYKSGRVMDEHVRQVRRYLRCLEQGGTAVARGLLIYLDRQAFRLVEPGSASELFTDLGAYPRYFCEDEA